ncbi:MAG: ABC transporter substrate-binding protein [Chloroflexota bacterium]|nr:ABC transporter substrate-binding protein [Chloroflexota bacterium]
MLTACGGGGGTTTGGRSTATTGTTDGGAGVPTTTGADTTAPTAPAASTQAAATDQQANPTPIQAAGNYKESPELAAMVEQKKLPPVTERLPKNPYVVPHPWVQPGKYGGRMQMAYNSDWGIGHFIIYIHMYGNTWLRLLKDGSAIGPGLVESWDTNDDSSQYTLHFREGLKWSDGKPWTTRDIMYWWEDLVMDESHPAGLPEEMRSGRGTAATLKPIDDTTLQITYDAPAPLTPVRLAFGSGGQMQPRHYMQQFHPKYNKKINPKSDWVVRHDEMADYAVNPGRPVMTGWKLRSQKEGVNTVWERNPYYWCVSKNGDQLPYIDGFTVTNVQNPDVLKLQYQQGQVDYVHGAVSPLTLSDVAALRRAKPRSKLDVRFWDSGSGTASMFFLNYDYFDPKVRAIFREPKFRKAISHAFNRETARKLIYFQTGEVTTGTFSPKAVEYHVDVNGQQGEDVYKSWRESALKYDPEMAKKLLDEVGLKDQNGDGKRELPNGAKFKLFLEYPADTSQEHVRKDELLARDLQAVGLDAQLNPVAPEAWGDSWRAGRRMTTTAWEVGDGPDHLTGPWWLVPIEPDRWAPLHGRMYSLRGTPEYKAQKDKDPYKRTPPRVDPEPGGPIDRLYKLYDRAKLEPDAMKRHQLVWDMIKIHIDDGPFFMGTVSNYPQIVLVREGLMNVPTHEDLVKHGQGGMVNTWAHPTPAVYDPESYFWDDPAAHS